MDNGFREIDDLVLQLKGLVLVRELIASRGAGAGEIDAHSVEMERVRERLASTVERAVRRTDAASESSVRAHQHRQPWPSTSL